MAENRMFDGNGAAVLSPVPRVQNDQRLRLRERGAGELCQPVAQKQRQHHEQQQRTGKQERSQTDHEKTHGHRTDHLGSFYGDRPRFMRLL